MINEEKAATLRVFAEEMYQVLERIMLEHRVPEKKARRCARLFTDNTLDGVYSHGVNRFARFVHYLRKGYIKPEAEPERIGGMGALERWDGHFGIGLTNAEACTDRAMELASRFGMGCVALARTNHWMRGGAYGWRAARKGFLFLGWTNTIANMPAWGAVDGRLGNNPLIMAVPFREDAIVLDMAASQFSYGSMERKKIRGEKLPIPGGYDEQGDLTRDPSAILASGRPLPAGYWKGSGLALLLDLFATVLSGGDSTPQISEREDEFGLSQVYIAIDPEKVSHRPEVDHAVKLIIDDLHASRPVSEDESIRYPGQKALTLREKNLKFGVPVEKVVWEEILAFQQP